jgi:hypothetical protein
VLRNEVVKCVLVTDDPDGRTVEEGACFIVAEATGEKELVKRFWAVGDLDGSWYAITMFYKGLVSFKNKFVDLRADLGWQREEGTKRSAGAWISHGESSRDDECILAPRKMVKAVGKSDGLVWGKGKRHTLKALGICNALLGFRAFLSIFEFP